MKTKKWWGSPTIKIVSPLRISTVWSRMQRDSHAEENKLLKDRVDAKNKLESYTYSLKNQVNDDEKLGSKLSESKNKKSWRPWTMPLNGWTRTQRRIIEELKAKRRWRILIPSSLDYTNSQVVLVQVGSLPQTQTWIWRILWIKSHACSCWSPRYKCTMHCSQRKFVTDIIQY